MELPGINSSLYQESDLPIEGVEGNWHERATPLTVRERVMMDVMATLKNKRSWEEKMFNEAIVRKWTSEAVTSRDSWYTKDKSQTGEFQGLVPAYSERQRGITEAMFRYVSVTDVEQMQRADRHIVHRRAALTGANCKSKRFHGSVRCECDCLHLRHSCGPRHKDGSTFGCLCT